MTKPKAQTCEVKIEGEWRAVSLTEAAVDQVTAVKRFPACHGRVMINGAYSGPSVRRFLSHRKSHSGCRVKANTYLGHAIAAPSGARVGCSTRSGFIILVQVGLTTPTR